MEYKDFYRLASYANIAWRGFFSEEEVACNAYEYKLDYDMNGTNGKIIQSLIEQLDEDSSDEAQDFLYELTH